MVQKPIFFLLLLLAVNSQDLCDKVSDLRSDMEHLVPEYNNLQKIHLLNYYFMDLNHSNSFSISIRWPSTVKFEIIPHFGDMKLRISGPTTENITVIHETPYLFYKENYTGILELEVEGVFSSVNHETISSHKKIDKICDLPYFSMQLLILDSPFRNSQLKTFKQKTEPLAEFDLNLGFQIPHEVSLKTYFLSIHDDGSDMMTVYKSDFQIETEKSAEKHKLIDFRISMYADFSVGGSLHFLLLKGDDQEQVEGFKCISAGKCIISHHPEKNKISMMTVLHPDTYYRFYILQTKNKEFEDFVKSIDNKIPIAIEYSMQDFHPLFVPSQCNARVLPASLDGMYTKDTSSYKFADDVVINTTDPRDELFFSTFEYGNLQVVAYFKEGIEVIIRLEEFKDDSWIQLNSSIKSDNTAGLYNNLIKDRKYKLVFVYDIEELDLEEVEYCEKYSLIISINERTNKDKCAQNTNSLDSLISNLENNLKGGILDVVSEEVVIDYNVYDNKPLYSKTFSLTDDHLVYFQVISDISTTYVIPTITSGETVIDTNEQKLSVLLSKGEYTLNLKHPYIKEGMSFAGNCFSFNVFIHIKKVPNQNSKCINKSYELIPSNLNTVNNQTQKSPIKYFAFNELIPEAKRKVKIVADSNAILKVATSSENVIVKLENSEKVLKTAKIFRNEIFEDKLFTIFHQIKENNTYYLTFEHSDEEHDFDCSTFELRVEIIPRQILSNLHTQTCEEHIPSSEDFIFTNVGRNSNKYSKYKKGGFFANAFNFLANNFMFNQEEGEDKPTCRYLTRFQIQSEER